MPAPDAGRIITRCGTVLIARTPRSFSNIRVALIGEERWRLGMETITSQSRGCATLRSARGSPAPPFPAS